MPGTASISGVISGLKTDEIISKLLELERMPITRLEWKRTALNAKLKAWHDANTRILAVKAKADFLAQSSTFEAKLFTSADETILKGSADWSAQAGTYYLKVNHLALAEQDKSQGYSDTTTTTVGTGTISITVGDGETEVITVDATNNTLTGLCQAINRAKIGVSAAIVNEGSGEQPYRLVITSGATGTVGELTINTSSLIGGTAPTFSIMQAAQDSSITMGEGENAITVTRSNNTVTDLISGITLNLRKADETEIVKVEVTNNTASLKQTIKDFVEQYNNLADFMNQQFKYDTNTNTGGALFSDQSLQVIQSELNSKLFNPVGELSQTVRVLSQIGITSSTKDNKLTIDEAQLDDALTDGLDNVRGLFAAVGEATNVNVSFIAAGADTKSSGTDGYAINITAVATQWNAVAGVAQSENLAQDEQLIINGKTIQLTAGMTPTQVAVEINKYTTQTGVVASRTDGYLTLKSSQYGSSHYITVLSDVAAGSSSSGLQNAQTRVTAGASQTQNLAQDETVTINGQAIELTAGMTPAQVLSKINTYTSQTGIVAARTDINGQGSGSYLTLVRAMAGPSQAITAVSTVSNGGGTPALNTSGIGTTQVTESSPAGETALGTGLAGNGSGSAGTNVAGTINGEAATGVGQTLTGNTGNDNTDGLKVRITAATTGDYGVIHVAKGIASILGGYLEFITQTTTGTIDSAQDTLNSQIEDIGDYITSLEERVTAREDRLIRQFATMESALSKLQNQGSFLSSQLAQSANNWS